MALKDHVDFEAYYRRELSNPNGRVSENGELSCSCCFHDDLNPSLAVNVRDGRYHCFGCGAGGSFLEFYGKRNGFDVESDDGRKAAFKQICREFNIPHAAINRNRKPSASRPQSTQTNLNPANEEDFPPKRVCTSNIVGQVAHTKPPEDFGGVIRRARFIWKKSNPAQADHPYLIKKQIRPDGLRVDIYENLLVSMYNIEMNLISLQLIGPDGSKKFLKSTPKKEKFHIINGRNDKLMFCEGYATGKSINEATVNAVVVCFDAGNLHSVVEVFREKFPDKKFVLCADNDAFKTRPDGKPFNIGLEKAFTVARKFNNIQVAYPVFKDGSSKPSDFNDLAVLEGPEELLRQVANPKSYGEILLELSIGDPSVPFQSENLAWLLQLRRNNPDQFMSLREQLKSAEVLVTKLDEALEGWSKNTTSKTGPKNPDQSAAADILSSLLADFGYDSPTDTFYQYKENYWQPFTRQDVLHAIVNAIDQDKVSFLAPYNWPYVEGIANFLKSKLRIELCREVVKLLPFKNGVYDLEHNKLYENDPNFGFDWQLPHNFDPTATCGPILTWFNDITGCDQGKVDFILAALAAIVHGRTDLQIYVEIIGPGGAGKGTLLWIMQELVGRKNTMVTELKHLENNRFETFGLLGKRLLLVTDAEKYNGEVSTLKAITGGDEIRVEQKFKQPLNGYSPQVMVIIAANEPISSSDLTSGLQRRRKRLNLDRPVPPDRQRDLKTEFKPFIPGLLNKILTIPQEHITIVLKGAGSQTQRNEARKAMVESNPLAAWLDSNCVFNPESTFYIGTATLLKDPDEVIFYRNEDTWLYANYCKYCKSNGYKPVSSKRFSRLLLDLVRYQLRLPCELLSKDSVGRPFKGIAIKNHTNSELPSPLDASFNPKEEIVL